MVSQAGQCLYSRGEATVTNTSMITLFKPGVPMVWAHRFARRLGGQLVGKVINGRLRVALVKEN